MNLDWFFSLFGFTLLLKYFLYYFILSVILIKLLVKKYLNLIKIGIAALQYYQLAKKNNKVILKIHIGNRRFRAEFFIIPIIPLNKFSNNNDIVGVIEKDKSSHYVCNIIVQLKTISMFCYNKSQTSIRIILINDIFYNLQILVQ